MAADKKAGFGDTAHRITKIWDFEDSVIGGTGTYTWLVKFKDWWPNRNGDDFPQFSSNNDDDSIVVLVMWKSDGTIETWDNSGGPLPVEEDFWAIGSGHEAAKGAHWMGADAVQAVEAANAIIDSCGLGVDVIHRREIQVVEGA